MSDDRPATHDPVHGLPFSAFAQEVPDLTEDQAADLAAGLTETATLPGPGIYPAPKSDVAVPGEVGRITVEDAATDGDYLQVIVANGPQYGIEVHEQGVGGAGDQVAFVWLTTQGADDVIEALAANRPVPVEVTEAGKAALASDGAKAPTTGWYARGPEEDVDRLFLECQQRASRAYGDNQTEQARAWLDAANDLASVRRTFSRNGHL